MILAGARAGTSRCGGFRCAPLHVGGRGNIPTGMREPWTAGFPSEVHGAVVSLQGLRTSKPGGVLPGPDTEQEDST